jgi:hypothetical protein
VSDGFDSNPSWAKLRAGLIPVRPEEALELLGVNRGALGRDMRGRGERGCPGRLMGGRTERLMGDPLGRTGD